MQHFNKMVDGSIFDISGCVDAMITSDVAQTLIYILYDLHTYIYILYIFYINNNIKYIGLFIIIILFGVFSLPKIYERVVNSDITDSNRLNTNERLAYLTISDEKRKAPDFLLTNQDSILISNDDMIGKVYVLEFFFTRCPDICIEMNQNMKLLDEEFGDSNGPFLKIY